MIPKYLLTEWSEKHPWPLQNQVEQDLLISRVLVELFSDPHIASSLAFRGGTALYKLFLTPAPRYTQTTSKFGFWQRESSRDWTIIIATVCCIDTAFHKS